MSWLSPKMTAVRRLYVCGHETSDIASILHINESSLRTQLWQMQTQLGCHNHLEGRMAMLAWMVKYDPIGVRIWSEKFERATE